MIISIETCPLNVLSEMGEEIRGSKILLNLSAFNRLMQSADKFEKIDSNYCLFWSATEDFPETTVVTQVEYVNNTDYTGYVHHILYIDAADIPFKTQWDNYPNEYLLLYNN